MKEGCETLDVLNEEIGLHFGYKPYLLPGLLDLEITTYSSF